MQRGKAEMGREARNNINIQINFNVKEKSIVGKKIDHFVAVKPTEINKEDFQTKNKESKNELQNKMSSSNLFCKSKDKEGALQKDKEKINWLQKSKDKLNVINDKTSLNIGKRSLYKNEQFAASASKWQFEGKNLVENKRLMQSEAKLLYKECRHSKKDALKGVCKDETTSELIANSRTQRKNRIAKSMENLKQKKHSATKNNSNSSPSRSSNRLLKTPNKIFETPNKTVFTNSNIKNRLVKANSLCVHKKVEPKHINQPNIIHKDYCKKDFLQKEKLRQFIQEKKKKEKKERHQILELKQANKNKINEELKKVEKERKLNASKPFILHKYCEDRMPIFYGEEDFDETEEYNKLKDQAEEFIQIKSKEKNNEKELENEDTPNKSLKEYEEKFKISGNKSTKKIKINTINEKKEGKKKNMYLFEKYRKKDLSQKEQRKFLRSVICIQAFLRGCLSRKRFRCILSEEVTRDKIALRRIQEREFWEHSEVNSVTLLSENHLPLEFNFVIHNELLVNYDVNGESNISTHTITPQKNGDPPYTNTATPPKTTLLLRPQTDVIDLSLSQRILQELDSIKKEFALLKHENENLKTNFEALSHHQTQLLFLENTPNHSSIKGEFSIEVPEEFFNKKQLRKQMETFECIPSPKNEIFVHKNIEFINEEINDNSSFPSPNTVALLRKTKLKEQMIEGKFYEQISVCEQLLQEKLVSPRSFEMRKKQFELQKSVQIKEVETEINKIVYEAFKKNKKPEKELYIGLKKFEKNNEKNEIKYFVEESLSKSFEESHSFEEKKMLEWDEEVKKREKEQEMLEKEMEKEKAEEEKEDDEKEKCENERCKREDYLTYFEGDIEEIHAATLALSRRIDEAILEESESTETKEEKPEDAGSNIEYKPRHEKQLSERQESAAVRTHRVSKSEDQSEEVVGSLHEMKAEEIFVRVNEIDLDHSEGGEEEQAACFVRSISPPLEDGRRRGFQTTLQFLRSFTISLSEYIRGHPIHSSHFLQKMSSPMQHKSEDYLRSYRVGVQEGNEFYDDSYNSYNVDYFYPYYLQTAPRQVFITPQLFAEFLEVYAQEDVRWNDPCLDDEVHKLREYYLVSIADVFNEALDCMRPGGVEGVQFVWLRNERALINSQHHSLYKETDEDKLEHSLDKIFGLVIAQLLKWGQELCGFIPEAAPNDMDNSSIILNMKDEDVQNIREGRMIMMLEKALLEEETKMLRFGQEYTEVLLHLTNKILDLLIQEISFEFSALFLHHHCVVK